jgi:peptide/nickel transport system permease protein
MSRSLKLALAWVIFLHGVIVGAAFFAPADASYQDRDFTFAPPTEIHFVDTQGHFHRPFVYGTSFDPERFGEYKKDLNTIYPIRFFVSGPEYRFWGMRCTTHLFGVDSPGKLFLFGSDEFGRDQFSRVLFGGQISLLAGFVATAISLFLGTVLGGIAGFFGKAFDIAIMRLAELFLTLPWFYLLFAIRAFLPLHLEPQTTLLLLTAVIGTVGWARPARLVRGVVLSAKERPFVLAARNSGASDAYLLRRHVLPQAYGLLITQATLLIPQYALAEVTLSFVGLGVGEPSPSWGTMLAALQRFHVLQSYGWMFFPAFVMVVIFLSYFLLASALEARLKSAQF